MSKARIWLLGGITVILVASFWVGKLTIQPVYAKTKPDCSQCKKVTICHATSSVTNPYVKETVSCNAAYSTCDVDHTSHGGHFCEDGNPVKGHENDILLEGDVSCPTPTPTPVDCVVTWGDCVGTCGEGTKTGTITTQPQNGGLACGELTRACELPACPTDVCPNLEGVQTQVPEGYHLNDGVCIENIPTVDPTPTPTEEVLGDKTSKLTVNQSCTDGQINTTIELGASDKASISGVSVLFSYLGNSTTVTTNVNGVASTTFGYTNDGDVTAVAGNGFPATSHFVTHPQNCPSTPDGGGSNGGVGGVQSQVLGASTTRGQVLGATTMASTGVLEDNLMNLTGLVGVVMTLSGSFLNAKKKK